MPFNRTSWSLIAVPPGMGPARLLHAKLSGGNAIAAYTGTGPDLKDENSGQIEYVWQSAVVSAASVVAAITALRPPGVGPVTLTHFVQGKTTIQQV